MWLQYRRLRAPVADPEGKNDAHGPDHHDREKVRGSEEGEDIIEGEVVNAQEE